MSRRRLPDLRSPSGPPPVVLALLAIEVVVVVVLLALGVDLAALVASAAPVITVTLALLNPTVQELGRRKPKLTINAAEADGDGVVAAPALRPWPIDIERLASNELADAKQTMEVRSDIGGTLAALADPFATRPTAADHERAQQEFREQLADYEADLRTWLERYGQASRERADSFELTLRLDNAASGAHADAITVVLDLPQGAERIDELPEIEPPPHRPTYQPPRPRRSGAFGRFDDYRGVVAIPRAIFASPAAPLSVQPETWTSHEDGQRLEAVVGDVPAGRSLRLGDPLLIRVSGPGRHEIAWTIFSKSLRRPATGTLVLDVPVEPERPAFGRLHGILSFPDVPIVDDELDKDQDGDEDAFPGERVARREVRSSDPPTQPPASKHSDDDDDGLSLIRRLDEASAWWEWRALGLDPAQDGPDRSQVLRAQPADRDQPPTS